MRTVELPATPPPPPPPPGTEPFGTSAGPSRPSDPAHRDLLERAARSAVGPGFWRQRQKAAVAELLAMAEAAPPGRLMILALHMGEEAQAILRLNVTVPCLHRGRTAPAVPGIPGVASHAVLIVRYPQEILTQDLPGTAFVQVREPLGVFHPNVEPSVGALCLGKTLPRATPLREIVWLSYAALTMQAFMFDERDAAGVINLKAARYWALNRERLPLSDTPFLEPADPKRHRRPLPAGDLQGGST